MKKQKTIPTWIPDEVTYNEIQKLIKFIEFVSNLENSTVENKQKATEIKYLIENINKPEAHKQWNVCLDIYDNDVRNCLKDVGFCSRSWSIYFENNDLEVCAESIHTANNHGHYGSDFSFYSSIYFGDIEDEKRITMKKNIDEFISDAMNYKSYITETLNDIEIDIDVW